MRIGINGIGVAGPALAYWLDRLGHEPVLFEKAPALRTGGYVIDYWGLGYDLAERMGILGELRERGYFIHSLVTVDAAGRSTATLRVDPLREAMGDRFVSIARSDLSAAVFAACTDVPANFGVSIDAVAQDPDGVDATMSNGRTERFDVVVGADGLHSRIRALEFGPEERFERPLGCVVSAFRVRGYPHRDELAYVSHTVTKRQVARIALRDDETLFLLICRDDVVDMSTLDSVTLDRDAEQKAALRAAFGDMAWEVPEILDLMDEASDFYVDRVSQIHLDRWSSGRVALVGDAAACASLLAGEGTGLAMVEAYVLAGELHRHGNDVRAGLRAYEQRLRVFIEGKQRSALRFRGFFAPRTSLGVAVRSLGVRAASIPLFARAMLPGSLRDPLELPRYEDALPKQ
ncbi:FAD-binding domain [Agromyces neolithicus]|uniref:FAD-binding domain n=1 Tax=Agromyces neolithicus TaxID=269420 RepID=A0ABN2LSM1_9MICO